VSSDDQFITLSETRWLFHHTKSEIRWSIYRTKRPGDQCILWSKIWNNIY